jgi:photosystem II stability/assembly factor-like uncharacterized protein
MRIAFACLSAAAAALLLLACSGGADPQTSGNGFRVVPTQQPTESGAWVVDPSDPMTLYALGRRSMRSRDGGRTWAELDWPGPAQRLFFAREPVPALYLQVGELYEAVVHELFKSLDDGESWSRVGQVPRELSGLVLIDQSSGPVLLQVNDTSVSRSTNEGSSWVESPLGIEDDVYLLTVGPARVSAVTSSVIYAPAAGFDATSSDVPFVLVSTDAGLTFAAHVLPRGVFTRPFPDLSQDCRGRLYTVADSTVYRSSDNGTTWESLVSLEMAANTFSVLQSPAAACSDALYALGELAGESTLYHLDAGGGVTTRPLPDDGVLSDLGDDRLLLVSRQDLRQRSDDGGRSWWTAGITWGSGDLVWSPARPGLLFYSTSSGVVRSEDGGTSWLPGVRTWATDLYPDPHDPNVVYALSSFISADPLSQISRDGGASFEAWPVPTQDDPQGLVAIASFTSGEVTVVTQKGVYTTVDDGRHFSSLLELSADLRIDLAAVGANEPPSIYASASGPGTQDQIYASVDGGQTWEVRDPGGFVDCLVAHPADSNVAFACSPKRDSEGFLRTLDGGREWSRFAGPIDGSVISLRIDPLPPHALYALGQRLYRSKDQGSTWQTLTDLPHEMRSFDFDPQPGGARYALDLGGLLYRFVE